MLLDALAWLSDTDQWTGPSGVLARLGQHMTVTGIALAAATLVALPAGVAIGHTGRGRTSVVAAAGAARAIPALGLLTLVSLGFGIGLRAPLVVLIVLAIPSMLAGAYSGIESINRSTIDAARSTGMSERQIITRVELPLAGPVILGGVRAAVLQVVATATLAAYVSDTGLGRYLFIGLKSRDYPQMLAGALLVAGLALALDLALAALQRRARSSAAPHEPRPRARVVAAAPRGTS